MAHRPELHVTAETGILDAPAGVLYDGQDWHIFLQFRPQLDDASRWGHQVSHELPFWWEECDDVLAPAGEEIKIRAGSVVPHGDAIDLYYTSVTDSGDAIKVATILDLAATTEDVSDVASTVTDLVVGHHLVVANQHGIEDFRSPCTVPDREEGWIMLAVAGPVESPSLEILTSPDGSDWSYAGPLELKGDTGLGDRQLVAPRIIRLRDQVDGEVYDILIVTVEVSGVDRSGYLVGQLRGTTFEVAQPFERIDYGHDFTRPRNTNLTATADVEDRYARAYLFGLMNGIGRLDDAHQHLSLKEEGWANCLSLPRKVTLQGGKLYQTPAAGLPVEVSESAHAAMFTGVMDVPVGSELEVRLIDSLGQTAATITHRGDLLELDRSMNQHHQDSDLAVAPLTEGDTDALTIVVDGSTVEVFADGGQVAMASRVYFNGTIEEFEVSTSGDAELERRSEIFARDARLAHHTDPEGPVR